MISPISQQTSPGVLAPLSEVSLKGSDAALLSRSSLSSFSGSSLSILNCFTSAWQWVKTHIFCCFSKASPETTSETTQTSETTETCPIPVVTEGGWFNKEINQQIRNLYSMEIPNQPDWASFPKEAAVFFHQLSKEIDANEENSRDIDVSSRADIYFNFPGIEDISDLENPEKTNNLKKETIQFLYNILAIDISLEMKDSMSEITIGDTAFQEIPEVGDNCTIPKLSEGQWLDIEINRLIRSLFSSEIQLPNHPEWSNVPKTAALLFHQIHQELNSQEFATDNPLKELNREARLCQIPNYNELNLELNLDNDPINPSRIDNLPFKYVYIKIELALILKAKIIHQEQQTERE